MVKIRGHYINLETAVSRREKIEKHLNELHWGNSYSRFSAETSNNAEASERGLTKGEYGLWKSWIKLLEYTIKTADIDSYDYLHILEDDAVLKQEMKTSLEKLNPVGHNIELIVTEMYTNEEIWRGLIEIWTNQRQKDSIGMLLQYTGCLSSSLIPKRSVNKVYEELKREYERSKILLPIDNTIVKLKDQKRLKVACTVPYLSSIDQALVIDSNIQAFEGSSESIILTQQVNGILREQLSLQSKNENYIKITSLLIDLAKSRDNSKYAIKLLTAALEIAREEDLFRYRTDPRLKDAPNNPQSELWAEKKKDNKKRA